MPPIDPEDLKRKNPFVDEQGKNPFAESDDPVTGEDSPYAAPQSGGGKTYSPEVYTTTAPHRAGFILALAITGGALAPAGFCCPIFPLGGAILSLMAVGLGKADLKAINAGAMDPLGRESTRLAFILGIIALLLCIGSLLFGIGLAILSILGNM